MPEPDFTPGPLGPCESYCGLEDLDCANLGLTNEALVELIVDASTILYALLGRSIHGVCTATITTDNDCMNQSYWAYWPGAGSRLTLDARVRYPDIRSIVLASPVVSIAEVKVDGVTLDPTAYILRDGSDLRLATNRSWIGDIEITYTFGVPVPGYARDACIELAQEMAKERCGRPSCFPTNAKSVSRAGISISLDREVEKVREAGPSLQAVMVAMSIINPMNQRNQSEVWSPDQIQTHAVRTFT